MISEIDCMLNDSPKCPYCGHEDPDGWEIQDDTEDYCGECSREYEVRVVCTVKYTTIRSDDDVS